MYNKKNPHNNYLQSDRNPDGSPDARRESTWLGTAGRLALGALMLAPFAGNIARGGMAAAKGLGALGKSFASNPGAAAGLAGQRIKSGAQAGLGMAKQAIANPGVTAGNIYAGGKATMGNVANRYKQFYGQGGPGYPRDNLSKARDYFGV